MSRWSVLWNATNLYFVFVLFCVLCCRLIVSPVFTVSSSVLLVFFLFHFSSHWSAAWLSMLNSSNLIPACMCISCQYLLPIDHPVVNSLPPIFTDLCPGGVGVFRGWGWGVFRGMIFALLYLVPHLPPLHTHYTAPHSWPLPLPGCSPTLAALLAPSFLSRPLPPLTGLAPP